MAILIAHIYCIRLFVVPPNPERRKPCSRRKISAGEGPGSLEETLESAAANEAEEILLDENEESKKSEFYQVRGFKVSPNHKLLAYAEDTVGGEKYTLHIKVG